MTKYRWWIAVAAAALALAVFTYQRNKELQQSSRAVYAVLDEEVKAAQFTPIGSAPISERAFDREVGGGVHYKGATFLSGETIAVVVRAPQESVWLIKLPRSGKGGCTKLFGNEGNVDVFRARRPDICGSVP